MKSMPALLLVLLSLLTTCVEAKIRLPRLVADSMVLQRDIPLNLWGWADGGEPIKVRFRGKSYTTQADPNGKWALRMNAGSAGGPFTMEIKGKSESITLRDILVGDVWLCAGQSNMVHSLELHRDRYAREIAAADFPAIRQFLVPTIAELTGPAPDLPDGSWKAATPKNVLRFSVVAYFFALNIYEKYRIPIGIINASVGGTPAEAWTSEEGLSHFPEFRTALVANKDTAYVNRLNRQAAKVSRTINASCQNDAGMKGPVLWYDPSFTPTGWSTIGVPGYWEDQGIKDLDGVVWYRREISVPASMVGKPARLALGRIVDADFVYLNGQLVGNKTYQYPQRRYDLSSDVLKEGRNVLVVRVINYGGKGGFVPDKPYYLATPGDTLDLKGNWQYKVGEAFTPPGFNPGGISAQNQPAALFNGMVAPLRSYALKGFIWYQGESNASRATQYERLLPALISDWRKQWQLGDLPFLYAQLPNFMEVNYLPGESQWAELREAQRKSLRVPNTAMAVTIDLGEWNDIHPGNKKPIGDRLALAARSMVYKETLTSSGPAFSKAALAGNKVTLQFDHAGTELSTTDGGPVKWVSVAGDDRKFVWANANIEGNTLVVWSDGVPSPVYVRYAWADNPAGANLMNKEGLPASPFEATVLDLKRWWHGKKAAVVLTYDDALDVHLDNVIPALDSLGLKGTFYLSAAFPGSKNRINDWRRAARSGHELGNHTLFHPCDATKPGRSWVSPGNDLGKYTTESIVREIEMTNIFLESIDGKKERTFAYTCGDTDTGEGSFVDAIRNQFISMRGVKGELNKPGALNLANLNCYVVDDSNADQLITWAEKAKEENAFLVVLFHGVGGGHSINVDLQKHNAFLSYLKEHAPEFWVTTLLDASKYSVQQAQTKP